MKKLLLLFVLLFSIAAFSQETKDIIYDKTDVAAEYEGGINKFREGFQKNFDPKNSFKGTGTYQTLITFIVDENGIISQVFATGNNDSFNNLAINAIKKIKGKWNPAKVNGNRVKSRFKFPMTMNFMN
ncbi:energy transducer TonB [Epilithonimonas caeni]|uniref:energy transducer TonB n=1 Tax=Epilithonimonas caeni TaxID=365343 RepID=UPI0004104E04|nr:hypothetical protein [Epilithonimonas caeni]